MHHRNQGHWAPDRKYSILEGKRAWERARRPRLNLWLSVNKPQAWSSTSQNLRKGWSRLELGFLLFIAKKLGLQARWTDILISSGLSGLYTQSMSLARARKHRASSSTSLCIEPIRVFLATFLIKSRLCCALISQTSLERVLSYLIASDIETAAVSGRKMNKLWRKRQQTRWLQRTMYFAKVLNRK